METPDPNTTKSPKLFPIFAKNFKPLVNPLKSLQLNLDDSKPLAKRPRKSLLGKTETPGMVQTILDAGQKEIGPRLCIDCGLLYSPGDFQDEEEHRKAHNRLENLFTIKLWKDVEILHTFVDGGLVVMIRLSSDSKKILNKLKDFTTWVDSELGVIGNDDCGNAASERMFIYLLPTKRKNVVRILGSVVMEIVESSKVFAYRIKPFSATSSASELQQVKISVGITRLWTDPNFRKKGIASRLCDMVRFHSGIPGCIVSKAELGILEPSENGRAFMYQYTGGIGAVYSYRA